MNLSKRMREILLVLLKYKHMTRNHIVYSIGRQRWDDITELSSVSKNRILTDKIRVSYDRTLRRLRELGLIEGGFPPELRPLSPYRGTLWGGYLYMLTDRGRTEAEKIQSRRLSPLEKYSEILMNALLFHLAE